jgi:hypothetical protein
VAYSTVAALPAAHKHKTRHKPPSRGKLSTEEVILTSAARAREIKTQKFGLPKFSPSQIGRKGKAQGQKAKGTEFEPRRSQNFLLKPLRPRAFSSRQGANIKPGLIRRALACANRGLSKLLNGRPARALVGATYYR